MKVDGIGIYSTADFKAWKEEGGSSPQSGRPLRSFDCDTPTFEVTLTVTPTFEVTD
jgi:hypothetical protein